MVGVEGGGAVEPLGARKRARCSWQSARAFLERRALLARLKADSTKGRVDKASWLYFHHHHVAAAALCALGFFMDFSSLTPAFTALLAGLSITKNMCSLLII